MFKKSLLMMLLMALLMPWAAKAQETVTIGDGTSSGYYTPIGTYYNYSITEQLYTAEEIGTAGTISSVSFYWAYTTAKDFNIAMYMANVDAADLSTGISLADADEVYTGTLSVPATAGWVTITLDTPFAYDGTSNLLIGFNKTGGSTWFSGSTWQYTSVANMARYTQNDSNAYDLTTVPGTITNNRPNIQIEITPGGGGPVCEKPETFEVSNVTTTTATLTWTGGSGNYNVEYKGGSVADWTAYLTNTTATTANLTGLTPGTAYQYRVQSVCGSDVSGWKNVSFSTMFGIPINEAFATTSLPAGWAGYSGLLNADGTATISTTTYGWYFGTNNGVFDSHARVNIYGTSCNYWLVTPAVLMENNVQLTFDLALTAYSGTLGAPATTGTDDRFTVLITTNGGETWTTLRQWDNAGSEYVYNNITSTATGEFVAIDLSSYAGQNIAIAFYGESTVSNADNNLHIDNVSIDYIPACAKPTGLAVSDVTAHTATISWTSDGNAWQIGYSNDNFATEEYVEVTENPYTLPGLAPETTYQVRVQTNCGGDTYSVFTNPVSFTTAVACTAPTGVTSSNLTGHGVTMTWTAEEGANYQYQMITTANYDANNINWSSPIEGNTLSWDNLIPETGYTFSLRKDCSDAEDGYSTVVTGTFTTTVACPAPTVAVTNITTTTADVTCTNTDAELFNVMLGEDVVAESVPMPYTLNNLTVSTNYTVKVQAICGGEDGESDWSSGTTFMTAEECPDGMVCIGTGTSTSSYVPAHNYYNYSLTEQIYTAAEIGMAGEILSIEFYKASTTAMAVNLDIYMVSTTKDEFTSTSDWITVTASDLVYSGTVTFVDNDWTNIELQSPFNYDGTSNLCIVVDNNTGDYESSTPFRVFTAAKNQALYQYSDGVNLDPTAASIGTASGRTTSKNRIRIAVGEPPACPRPTQVAVNYEGGSEATVTWNGEATSYNIDVNGTVTNNVTSPYQLTGLALATTYEVKVQANCGSNLSEWTNAVSFTTDLCLPENMCEITFELTDSYGDGWNGGELEVVDAETSKILGTYTVTSGGSGNYTLNVCDGRTINIVYIAGSYSTENGWVVTDINGEVICEHVGCNSGCNPTPGVQATYTANCAVTDCRRPSNVAVTDIFGHSATLSWTESGPATEWTVEVTLLNTTAPVEPMMWSTTSNPFEITGLQPESTYSVRVLPLCEVELWSDPITFTTNVACPAPRDLTASEITTNSAVIYWEGEGESYNLRYRTLSADEQLPVTIILYAENVWDDGTGYQMLLDADYNTYGTIIPETGGLTSSGDASAEVYAEFEYKIPENADGSMTTTNVLIDQTISIQIPAGTYDWCITNPTPGDRIWIASSNGNIPGRYDDYEFEAGKTYEFHVSLGGSNDRVDLTITGGAKSGDAKDDEDDEEWIAVMEDVVSPVTLSGLDPETSYVVQVRANCGEEDGYSEWAQTYFTTKGLCDVPNNLTATDVEAHNATLNWNGSQNSFNVRYRTAFQKNIVYFTNFNEGYDALHEEGWDWIGNIIYGLEDPIYNIPANDNYFIQMGWATTEEAYIISPELPEYESGCILEYYAFAYNTNNTFQIGYSTNTQELEDFEWSEPIEANTNHYDSLYSEVLPDGVKYVAFKATAESQGSCIFLDNFGIFGAEDIPAGDWNTVNNITATTLQIVGLTPETEYEWQVQGKNRSCEANSDGMAGVTEWSASATFITTPSCIVPTGLVYSNGELSWISNATSFDVEFEGYDVIEGVTNPYTPDLDPETIYYVRVRANCGDEDGLSDWTDYYGFVTDCDGAKDLPYAYGFEDMGDYYACWISHSYNTENNCGLAYDPNDDNNIVFRFSSYYNADDFSQILISPELNTETPVTVSFDYMTYNSSTEIFYVGYTTTTETDLNAFTWSDPMEVNNNTEWATFTATYPAGTKHVAVLYYSNYMYYLYLDNFLFEEPASMEIVGYDEGEANWYLIASPIESDPANISGMTDGDYDLYRFNPAPSQEGEEWENSKIDTAFLLVAGQGYLYAHSTDITLVFDGTTENYDPVAVPLNYDATDNHKCWNLVGNPFTCEATIDMDYYVMNANGTGINPEPVLATTPIQPYTAVFVTATNDNQFVTFTAVEPTTDSTDAKGRLRIRLNENNHPANTAAVSISENKGSNSSMKNKELNTVNTKVNMSISDKETYNMESYDKMPINFKAEKKGVYTLNFTIENMTFGYLRLHDAATNTDVDLLANPEYTFKAKAGEDASRFFIEYKVK